MKISIHKLLSEIKQEDLENNVPSISPEVAAFLHRLIVNKKLKSGLEIGTAHGYSTLWIAHGLAKNNGTLISLEHSTPSFEIAKNNINKSKLPNITLRLGRAQEIIPKLKQTFDFVFIDGHKKSTLEFFSLCSQKLTPNGIIVVDDVLKFRYKMENFWAFIQQNKQWKYNVHKLDEDDGIMVITRR